MLSLAILVLLARLFQNPSPAPSAPPPVASSTEPVGHDGIIGADGRKLVAEFEMPGAADQAAMRLSLGATQRLTCGASASLVYRNDTIVFSAHQIVKEDGTLDPDLMSCAFMVARLKDGVWSEERYPLLLDTLDHGGLGTDNAGSDDVWDRDSQRDWSVVRLARPVEGIEPYALPDDPDHVPDGPLVTVSDTTDNWKGSSEPQERIAQSCRAIAVLPEVARSYPAIMHLDCDVGRGASGGALLSGVASGQPRYVGTTIAYTGNQCRTAGLDTCFSIARRLDPDLIERIRGTTVLRRTPLDEAFSVTQAARLSLPRDRTAKAAAAALTAAFPSGDDAQNREVAALYGRIRALVSEGRAAEADPLFLTAYRDLHDPDQRRPEWSWLLIENGDAMLAQNRPVDAFQCFRSALAVAPEPLKPYLRLRMAATTPDEAERTRDLREAYLAGGDALFQLAAAGRELAALKAGGIPTADDDP